MARIGLKLREIVKNNGVQAARDTFREALREGKITRNQVSLRELAESLIGPQWADRLRETTGRARLRESIDAVDASGFAAITGQLLVDTIKEKYKMATMVTDQLVTTLPITNGNLGPQREPWLSDVMDDPAHLQQKENYPQTAFVGQYIDYPAPQKFGRICAVTFEAIYSDLTGQILDSAGSVGRRTGLWVENQRLRVMCGAVNNHSWNGTAYNTYQTATPWVNAIADFTLTDWKSVQKVELLFAQMRDPVTGWPIDIEGMNCLTVPPLKHTARRIFAATETRSGDITSGAGDQTISVNPLDNYQLYVSKHLYRILTDAAAGAFPGLGLTEARASTFTLWGDFKRAFVWREVYPLQVVQAPPNDPAEFNQDVVLQVKAGVFGVAAVRDPRFVVRAYNASA